MEDQRRRHEAPREPGKAGENKQPAWSARGEEPAADQGPANEEVRQPVPDVGKPKRVPSAAIPTTSATIPTETSSAEELCQ